MARSAMKSKGAMAGQLRLEVEHARARADRPRVAAPTPPQAPPAVTRSVYVQESATPFGGWLLKQKGRGGAIEALAKAAAADPRFPKAGSPDDVRAHISRSGGDPDMFEAIDDAETEWLCY